jgi:hypothetical protein
MQIKPPTTAEPITQKLSRLTGARLQSAAVLLDKSLSAAPGDWRTRRALSEVELRLAFLSRDRGDLAATTLHADGALAALDLPKQISATSGQLRAGVVVRSARIGLLGPAREDAERRASLKLFEQLAVIDPFNPDVPYQSFRIAKAMGLQTEAREFAARAIALQADTGLDPLARGLTDAQLAELRAEVGQSMSPSGPGR